MQSRLDAALAYAQRGWAVLPLNGKLPAIAKADGGRGVHDATTDTDKITEWWTRKPHANIGLACGAVSGFWVLDIDPRHSGDETLEALEKDHGLLPATVEQFTGGGGRHVLFKTNGRAIRNGVGKIGAGLDIRSDGGYVVVDPSCHPVTKQPYAWSVDFHPDEIDIAPAPDWLVELVADQPTTRDASAHENDPYAEYIQRATVDRGAYADAALASEADNIKGAAIGEQEHKLNFAALKIGQLVGAGGLDFDIARDTLTRAGQAMANDPGREPWTADAIKAKVERGLRDGMKQPREIDAQASSAASGFVAKPMAATAAESTVSPAFSDDALALQFTNKYGDDLRYVAAWSRWLRWTGQRWRQDETVEVFDLARTVCRAAAAMANTGAKTIASAKTVAAVERLARADRRHAATVEQWDADPWALNTPDGVIDLRTGFPRPHDRADHATKLTAAAPSVGGCPTWHDFLDRVTDGDRELQGFLQRMAGYSLSGSTREHSLFFLYGTGANGKSVFINAVSGIAGDYATTAPMETFLESRTERHPTDLAGLRGARLVTASETEGGRRWAESKIKALTGGDKIAARFMRQDFFEFTPQFKLLIAGNHKPGLRNIDEAIRRRLHLIPFTVTIPKAERDHTLPDKLKTEWPGILSWMIEGAIQWHAAGLQPPNTVRAATDEYLAGEDTIERWIGECCTKGRACQSLSTALYTDWKHWCEDSGEWVGSQKRFSQALEDRGYQKTRQGGTGKIMFIGLAIGAPSLALGDRE